MDFESFEDRAMFLGRTLEEELVAALDGVRGGEARLRLEQLAERQGTSIENIIINQEEIWRQRDFARSFPSMIVPSNREDTPTILNSKPKMPECIYPFSECPVCQDENALLFVMSCGHQICNPCFTQLSKHHEQCKQGVNCPTCRETGVLWSVDTLKFLQETNESPQTEEKKVEQIEDYQPNAYNRNSKLVHRIRNYCLQFL